MNKSFLFGVSIVGVVVYYGVFAHAKVPRVFLDPHAILLVIGGTIASGFIAFQGQSFSRAVDFVVWGVLFRRKRKNLKVAQDIAVVRLNYIRKNKTIVDSGFDPFLTEAIEYLFDKQITTEGLVDLLRTRSYYFSRLYKQDAKVLASLGKYPPAFGLLGASTGMIEMMQHLGSGGSAGIGQAMAVALVATFWGIAIANLVILPLADAASKAAQEDGTLRDLIIDGLKLIREGASDQQFKGHLRGYLSLEDRRNFITTDSSYRPNRETYLEEEKQIDRILEDSNFAYDAQKYAAPKMNPIAQMNEMQRQQAAARERANHQAQNANTQLVTTLPHDSLSQESQAQSGNAAAHANATKAVAMADSQLQSQQQSPQSSSKHSSQMSSPQTIQGQSPDAMPLPVDVEPEDPGTIVSHEPPLKWSEAKVEDSFVSAETVKVDSILPIEKEPKIAEAAPASLQFASLRAEQKSDRDREPQQELKSESSESQGEEVQVVRRVIELEKSFHIVPIPPEAANIEIDPNTVKIDNLQNPTTQSGDGYGSNTHGGYGSQTHGGYGSQTHGGYQGTSTNLRVSGTATNLTRTNLTTTNIDGVTPLRPANSTPVQAGQILDHPIPNVEAKDEVPKPRPVIPTSSLPESEGSQKNEDSFAAKLEKIVPLVEEYQEVQKGPVKKHKR